MVSDAVSYDATLLGYDEDVDVAVLRICCNKSFSHAQLVESGEWHQATASMRWVIHSPTQFA